MLGIGFENFWFFCYFLNCGYCLRYRKVIEEEIFMGVFYLFVYLIVKNIFWGVVKCKDVMGDRIKYECFGIKIWDYKLIKINCRGREINM